MPRSRRLPRRQGVVYGPVEGREGYDAGSLVGRILGMLVVAGAVGALVVGAMSFLGGDGPFGPASGSPRPTAIAGASPTGSPASAPGTARPAQPTASPVTPAPPTQPPATTAPSPTSDASPADTPPAGPADLQVREGPGHVTFGTQSNSALMVTDARTSFALDERITWSAQMTEPANAADMRIETSKVGADGATEEVVLREEVRPRVSGARTFLRRLRPDRLLDGPGIYVVRYLRGDTVMSQGAFEVRP